jgi:uncharacterized repeat protein (TIGR02059 family)
MKKVFFCVFISLSSILYANTYYVSTIGKDSNSGTISSPWLTWQKAFNTAQAGDTVYFRGGIWYPKSYTDDGNTVVVHAPRHVIGEYTGTIHGYNGTAGNPVCFFNYPGEVPILDCSQVDTVGHRFNTGLGFTFSMYVHVKGLTIRNVYQPTCGNIACGVGADGCAHMIFTNMNVYNIGGRGMTYWGANGYFDIENDSVEYYNCDIHNCYDPYSLEPGNGADGWKGGNEPGGYFHFEGCRAWNCSDDGFDVSGNSYAEFINCWSWGHGWLGDQMDGNGFKFGAVSDSFPDPMRKITNCLAAFNFGTGFFDLDYSGYYRNNSRIYNNTSYKNGYGFVNSQNTLKPWYLSIYRNNIAYKSTEITPDGTSPYNACLLDAVYTESNNTWKLNDPRPGSWPWFVEAIAITDADFISVDSTGISGPRKTDGSLPDIHFLKISSTSKLKDAGIDVGLPYYGSAPDLGYSEYSSGTLIPPSPVYQSSVIQNATPSKLEMTYSLTLANVVPATSAFTVKVNSASVTVSSVIISGVKVTLTLGSVVKYGDVVTIAYNKPTTNPIQTSDGGQAASITAQNVTNNIAPAIPVYVSSVIENASPSKLEMTYNLSLANIVPASSAFTVKVNSTSRSVSSVVISGTKVTLTLSSLVSYGDAVTVAYTKPSSNPLQTTVGGQAATMSAQTVINNCSLVANQPPNVDISSPTKNTSFTAPATITINAVASDPDGSISKVEFYSGNSKLGESSIIPYSYVWKDVSEGTFILTAVAVDNLNAMSTSEAITVIVEKSASTVNQLPVISIKNPNKGRNFKKNEKVVIEAEASDPDGEITKVEFKNGDVIIAEVVTAPYIYIMENADTGKYIITAIATDNLGATAVSSETDFTIYDAYYHDWDLIRLYPNPNNGHFTLDLTEYESENAPDRVRIIEMSGKTLMDDNLVDQQTYREFYMTNASAGTYIMMLSKNNTIISTGKFIIK